MKQKLQTLLFHLGLTLCLLGSLALYPLLSHPEAIKTPLLAFGLLVLILSGLLPKTITFQSLLAFPFFLLLIAMRGNHPSSGQAALLAVVGAMAYLIGLSRITIPKFYWIAALWLIIARGVADLLTLNAMGHPRDVVTSFFMDRHVFAGVLLCGIFALFYLIDKSAQRDKSSLPAFIYTTLLACLVALLLSDSRSAQGTFFLLFLPLLFLSVRLDFKEPHPERLFWVSGLALCSGMVWLNLPERQLTSAFSVFSAGVGSTSFQHEWAWDIFSQHFWLGMGTGALPWSHAQVTSANSHFLQRLAENGFIGLCLEAALIGLALTALGKDTLRSSRPGPRIIAFSLVALCLHGLFTSALESAPLQVLYFGFIGYGGSYATGKTMGTLGKRRMLLLSALILAVFYTGFKSIQELRADRLYQNAAKLERKNPRDYTNGLAAALTLQPNHPEANYAYAKVLSRFGKSDEARTRLDILDKSIPDPTRLALTRAEIRIQEGLPGMALIELEPVLAQPHPPLEAFEMQVYALAKSDCVGLNLFKADSLVWLKQYPLPAASAFTLLALTDEFHRGEEANFLQRAFGGRLLRQRFVERRMEAYHTREFERQRLKEALATPCQVR